MQELLKLKEYSLITFATTSQALKAEKILQIKQREFLLVPTLREISASCGLSIKLRTESLEDYCQDLKDKNVEMDGIYEIQLKGKGISVKKRTL